MTGRATVIRADAAHIPLADESVDLIICSPPYYGLRAYLDGGEVYDGQIGSEATPKEWLDALLTCTKDWIRVLKPEGSLFVNLGDKYAGSDGGSRRNGIDPDKFPTWSGAKWRQPLPGPKADRSLQPKSLLGLPWRYAIGCVDDLGLILRAEIIWAKPNGLPESVTDRVRRAHEQVFHFTRLPRYYSAVDEIREPQAEPDRRGWNGAAKHRNGRADGRDRGWQAGDLAFNPLGKLPGSVWSIPSQPLQVPAALGVDHFAAFPMELPRRLVLGWSPPGVCTGCGQGRRPVVDKRLEGIWHDKPLQNSRYHGTNGQHQHNRMGQERAFGSTAATITGYACACPQPTAPTRPALVVDPFGGTGTTALVASVLGRHGITADLSADYCRLAAWRCTDPGERARALQVPKPPPVADGQEALFGL